MPEALIVDAVRSTSGRGRPGGRHADTHPVDLLAAVLRALVDRNGLDPAVIDDVIGGCVTQAGEQAMNVTRQAVLAAGFPVGVPATTVDRQCGSSQQALHFAAHAVQSGAQDVVIVGGVESMSRAPMWSNWLDRDPYGAGVARRWPDGLVPQGVSAELVVAAAGLTRADLDGYAVRSQQRAAQASAAGWFDRELVPVSPGTEAGPGRLADETLRPDTTVESLAGLRAAFHSPALAARFPEATWQVTAGNSSPLTDGASAALVVSGAAADRLGLRPRARVVATAVRGDDPRLMLTAVVPATRRVLDRADLTLDDIDRYEVNEAFACVPLYWQRELGADPDRLNVAGGAIALGHPLGASGTRILGTLLGNLERAGGRYGLQTICEAGGMANALIIERLP
ncbi:thiolase family protein [Micromonospora sp. CB01531]|uniref:thiolase family protein n=1 Tax=Micromonospora sp. CB01531 TaxID=1718947 RepID=UPI00093D161D|nr:thiolase family protein [Micromonospora sp. CB01531]OKI63379.1 acetyl-CoA acetyltransferase [Micromonospora sp. CB01531]